MQSIHFDQLDLNLLRVFEALIEERSATRAGSRLGLTQSAISHALNRLRYMLKDELFVRGQDGMQPTGRADLAIGRFRRAPEWAAIEPLLNETRVWVLSADNPAANEEMTLERLAELPHLVIAATGEDERAIDGYVVDHGLERLVTRSDAGLLAGALAARGLRRNVAVTTSHILAALATVSQSDIAALLP